MLIASEWLKHIQEPGIPTRILADRHEAGEVGEMLAIDYDCDRALIQQPIEYECKTV